MDRFSRLGRAALAVLVAVAAAVGTAVAAVPASAADSHLVTATFTGTLDVGYEPGAGDQGDPVTGTVTWDTSLPPDETGDFPDGSWALYEQPAPPTGVTMTFVGSWGTEEASNVSLWVTNRNEGGVDLLDISFHLYGYGCSVTLWDDTGTVFSDTALPTTIDLADFTAEHALCYSASPSFWWTIDTFTMNWEEMVEDLAADVAALDLPQGVSQAADMMLQNAMASLERGQDGAAANELQAFVRYVQALERSGGISAEDADALIASAQEIIDLLQ